IAQIEGFHNGSLRLVSMDDLDGLISFPSFHVAGALIFAWVFRHRMRIFIPLVLVNLAVIVSTFMTGEHYVVDVLVSLPLFAASVALYRCWGCALLVGSSVPASARTSAV